MVTVWPTPNGLPIASTTSPTRACSAWPSTITGRFLLGDADHRQVGFGIGADHLGRRLAAVRQHHLDLVGGLDHVVVGQDVAVGADDDARTRGWTAARSRGARSPKNLRKKGIAQQRMVLPQRLAGEDVDHCRHGAPGGLAVAADGRGTVTGACSTGTGVAGADACQPRRRAGQPLGPHRLHHHVQRQRDGDGLRKQQPETSHRRISLQGLLAQANRGFRAAAARLPASAAHHCDRAGRRRLMMRTIWKMMKARMMKLISTVRKLP